MKKLSFNLPKVQEQKTGGPTSQWEAHADEVSEYFGKPLYFLFHQYRDFQILEAFKVCQEKNIKTVGYFIGILKKLKEKEL
jgi:hypothetical protein